VSNSGTVTKLAQTLLFARKHLQANLVTVPELDTHGFERVSPPESGGVAATKEISRRIISGADGVVPLPKRFKNAFSKNDCSGTTPSVRLKEASRNLLTHSHPS
jgi:hypothetical protein